MDHFELCIVALECWTSIVSAWQEHNQKNFAIVLLIEPNVGRDE